MAAEPEDEVAAEGSGDDSVSAPVANHPPLPIVTTAVIVTPASPSAPTEGQMLREWRREVGLTQRTLALWLGYSQQQVSLWELDIQPIPESVLDWLDEASRNARTRKQARWLKWEHLRGLDSTDA